MERAEKEAQEAQDMLKVGEAAKQVAALEKEAAGQGKDSTPDRLAKVRARRRSRGWGLVWRVCGCRGEGSSRCATLSCCACERPSYRLQRRLA